MKEDETNLLDEILKLAKKYGYTVTDVMLNMPRFEVGMTKEKV